jgi:N-acetylmuramoyl-L-alanine amidase
VHPWRWPTARPSADPVIATSGTSGPIPVVMALLAAGALLLAGCAGGSASGPSSGAGGTSRAAASPTASSGKGSGGGTEPGSGAGSGGPVAGSPVVVLDPGHNGGNAAHPAQIGRLVTDGRGGRKPCNTTGTATDAGYPEHAFTFDVARRTERALESAGVRVVLTRPDDAGVGPCVDVRGTAGQHADAAAVVAIHADGAAASGSGFHVALAAPPLNAAQAGQAHALGAALRDALRGAGFHDSTYLGDQGISLRPDLAGLNLATRPAALVECANMRNPAEAAVVSSADGRQRYATALATGIVAYLRHG